jgi:hypothetical protein
LTVHNSPNPSYLKRGDFEIAGGEGALRLQDGGYFPSKRQEIVRDTVEMQWRFGRD